MPRVRYLVLATALVLCVPLARFVYLEVGRYHALKVLREAKAQAHVESAWPGWVTARLPESSAHSVGMIVGPEVRLERISLPRDTVRALAWFPEVTSLTIDRDTVDADLLSEVAKLTSLNSLDLQGRFTGRIGDLAALHRLRSLEIFSYAWSFDTRDALPLQADSLAGLESLESLQRLEICAYLLPETMEQIGRSRSLEVLTLKCARPPPGSLVDLGTAARLTELKLDVDKLDQLEGIESLVNLQRLNIAVWGDAADSHSYVQQLLKMRQLESLDIYTRELEAALLKLTELPTLKTVVFHGVVLTAALNTIVGRGFRLQELKEVWKEEVSGRLERTPR